MEWKDKIDAWVNKMGYHFAIDSFEFPENAVMGENVTMKLMIDNVGVAPIYKSLMLMVKLKGECGEVEFKTDIDIRKWLPGKSAEEISIAIPSDISSGEYDIEIGILSPHADVVYFATDAERDGGFYKVGRMKICK